METPDQLVCHSLVLQLSLLDALAQSLHETQSTMFTSDLSSFEAQTDRQLDLCRALQKARLDVNSCAPDRQAIGNGCSHSPATAQHQALENQVRIMEGRVRQLNRIHACLLRRAQRSLAVYRRIVASQSLTYGFENVTPESRRGG